MLGFSNKMCDNNKNIKVLMFGWEFPPFNSGGLGVACQGLTRGLARQGTEILFVLPKIYGTLEGDYMQILSAEKYDKENKEKKRIRFKIVDSILKPYLTSPAYIRERSRIDQSTHKIQIPDASEDLYGSDLFSEIKRYSIHAKNIALLEDFDIIHCHDWLTFPAGITAKKIAELRGLNTPLITHIHATEFDRTAGHPNQYIYDIEREGMHLADYVITVSEYTKNIIIKHYGIDPEKIYIVHNAIDFEESRISEQFKIKDHHKIVLFLGRMTIQKGPDHFLRIAKRISEIDDSVRFVMVGSGDMSNQIIEESANLGIGDKVLFSDFLNGEDVDRAYRMADVYVMSSISEPFGITPLEAMKNSTPVVISKQSGVSEILKNCLIVDFWDVDLMTTKILSILHNPEFRNHLSEEGLKEVKLLNWDRSANKCVELYKKVLMRC